MDSTLYLFWGRRGGGAKYATMLYEELLKKNPSLIPSFSKESDFFNPSLDACINFNIHTYKSFEGFILKTLLLPITLFNFFLFMKKHNIKQVLCPMSHLWNIFLIPIMKLLKIRYILVAHDALPHPGDNIFFRNLTLRYEIHCAKTIITLSKSVSQQVNSLYDKNTHIIPHGVFWYGRKGYKSLKGPYQLTFFGRILHYKGLKVLLDSIELINKDKSFPKVTLSIYGMGNISKEESEIIDRNLNIELHNYWISEEDIAKIFDSSTLTILPYIEASQSGVIPIAFGKGVPVLASSVGGLRDQLNNQENGDLGFLFETKSPKDLKNKINAIFNDPQKYEDISKAAYQFAENNLSWERVAEKFNLLLNNKEA